MRTASVAFLLVVLCLLGNVAWGQDGEAAKPEGDAAKPAVEVPNPDAPAEVTPAEGQGEKPAVAAAPTMFLIAQQPRTVQSIALFWWTFWKTAQEAGVDTSGIEFIREEFDFGTKDAATYIGKRWGLDLFGTTNVLLTLDCRPDAFASLARALAPQLGQPVCRGGDDYAGITFVVPNAWPHKLAFPKIALDGTRIAVEGNPLVIEIIASYPGGPMPDDIRETIKRFPLPSDWAIR